MSVRISPAVLLAGALTGALVTVVALFTVVALLLIAGGAVNTINFSLGMLTLLLYLMQAPMLLPLPMMQAPPCVLEASLACLGNV